MKRKLIVRIKGGLGNQLFCYAAARRLAYVNDAELVIDSVTGFKYDHKYKRKYELNHFQIPARYATSSEIMEPFGRIRRLFARNKFKLKPLELSRYIQQVGVDYDPRILNLRLQEGSTYFDVFGQSELYFNDIKELLKMDLKIDAPSDEYNKKLLIRIKSSNSVAVHMRWFDNGLDDSQNNIDIGYYKKGISLIISELDDIHFYIFSDLPEDTENLFMPILGGYKFTFIKQDKLNNLKSINDFFLMMNCKHFIIGNSTFAWWAAWLSEVNNNAVDVKVVAPFKIIMPLNSNTAWGFNEFLPKRWYLI